MWQAATLQLNEEKDWYDDSAYSAPQSLTKQICRDFAGFCRIYVGYVGIMSGSCWILLGRRLWIFFTSGFCWVLLDFAGHICWAFVGHAGNCWDLAGFCWATNLAKYVWTQHAGICRDLAAFCWAHIFYSLENVGYLHHNLSPCCKMMGTLLIVYFLAGYCWAYKFDLLENVGHLKSPCWKMSGTQTWVAGKCWAPEV